MGYSTDFDGCFTITPALKPEDCAFLTKLSQTRRMKRNVGPSYGIEGEFYVDGNDDFNTPRDPDIIDYNHPPSSQPGLWCQWVPTEDGQFLEWDGGEKFYGYVEWLAYLVDKILAPRGYVLDGEVEWMGEEPGDRGMIVARHNKIFTRAGAISYGEEEPCN